MGWLKGVLHPTRLSHEDLERQAAEELRQLTADARRPESSSADGAQASETGPGAGRARRN